MQTNKSIKTHHRTRNVATLVATNDNDVATNSKREFNKDVANSGEQMDVYLDVVEVATLLGISTRQVQRLIEAKKITSRPAKSKGGRGGLKYQILLSSLTKSAKEKYQLSRLPEREISTPKIDENIYASIPEYNRKTVEKYKAAFRFCGNKRGNELRKKIAEFNEQFPQYKTSYDSYIEAKKAHSTYGVIGLVSNYGKTKGVSWTIEALGQIGSSAYKEFEAQYMTESKPSVEWCWNVARGLARELWAKKYDGDVTNFDETFPCVQTFLNKLKTNFTDDLIYRARYGKSNWNRKYNNYINRDYSKIIAGRVWVSDHRQLDQMWIMPDGRKLRAWFTAWIDFKTRKVLSWSIHPEAPNSDHVLSTFADGVKEWGVPTDIIIDNGKDYRCNDFGGGRKKNRTVRLDIDTLKATPMLEMIGVTAHFAKPYGAQTKPIENMFRTFKEHFDKIDKGYTGGNHVERPEILESRVKSDNLTTYADGVKNMEYFINEVYSNQKQNGKVLKGRSPDEVFYEELRQHGALNQLSEAAYIHLYARNSTIRTIGRNGIKDRDEDNFYWAEWMYEAMGKKVYLRRSMKSWQKAWVFDVVTDTLLGEAILGGWDAPALAKTDFDKNIVRQKLEQKSRAEKKIRSKLASIKKPLSTWEVLGLVSGDKKEIDKTMPKSKAKRMTKYDQQPEFKSKVKFSDRARATGTDNVEVKEKNLFFYC